MAVSKKKAVTKKKSTATKTTAKKTAAKKSGESLDEILANWNTMNAHLNGMTEETCLRLLRLEQDGRRRPHMLTRIHARFTKLRSERERIEIMNGVDIAA